MRVVYVLTSYGMVDYLLNLHIVREVNTKWSLATSRTVWLASCSVWEQLKGLNGDFHISFFVIRYRYQHFLNETIDIFVFSTASHKNSADEWQTQPLYGNIMVAVPVLETNTGRVRY